MNTLTDKPRSRSKLLGSAQAKIAAAAAATVVLVLGAATAPRQEEAPVLSPPEERMAPLLAAEIARRQSLATFERVQEIGNRVIGYSVAFPAPSPPARQTQWEQALPAPAAARGGAGVVIAPDGKVLTHVAALNRPLPVTYDSIDGMAVGADVVAYEPETGLVLLRPAYPFSFAAAPLSRERPAAGAVTTAAARVGDRDVVAPVVLAVTSPRGYGLGGGEALPPGTPLYDTEGALLAVTAAEGWAYAAGDAVARLDGLAASGRGAPAYVGIALQPRNPSLAQWFGDEGVIVADVEPDGPAASAGLRPGDLLLALDAEPLQDVTDALAKLKAVTAGRDLAVRVRRGGEVTDVLLTPIPAVVRAIARSPVREPAPDTLRLRDLPGGEHTAPPAPPDARLLSVNMRSVASGADAAREVARSRRQALLYVEHSAERYFVTIPRGRR